MSQSSDSHNTSSLNVVDWCLQELLPPGDDFYYATLYSRKSKPEQVIACGLLKLMLQSGLAIEEPTVRLAKLNWWLAQLKHSRSISVASSSIDSDLTQEKFIKSEIAEPHSRHPLIRYLIENRTESISTLKPQLELRLITLLQQLIVSSPERIMKGAPSSLAKPIGEAILCALGNQQQNDKNNLSFENLGQFWLAQHFCKHSTANVSKDAILASIEFLNSPPSSKHWSLSARSYAALMQLWLKVNHKAAHENTWYEPSAPRKLFTVWKTRLFHR